MSLRPEIWIFILFSCTISFCSLLNSQFTGSKHTTTNTHTNPGIITTRAWKFPNAPTAWLQSLYIHINKWKYEMPSRPLWHLLSDTTRAWQIHWRLNTPASLSDRSKQVNGLTRNLETGSAQTHSGASGCSVVHIALLALALQCLDGRWHTAIQAAWCFITQTNEHKLKIAAFRLRLVF